MTQNKLEVESTVLSGQYKGLNFRIEMTDENSSYSVYEFTPISHQKCEILSGASANTEDGYYYTEARVRQLIDDALSEGENN